MKKYIFILIFVLFASVSYAGSNATSGITAQTIIDRARATLNETTEGFWLDTDFLKWINDAVWTINSKTGCIEKSVGEIVLIENQWTYDMNATAPFLRINHVIHDSEDPTDKTRIFSLERIDPNILGHATEQGRPKTYFVFGDNINVWPIPNSVQNGTSIFIYAVAQPSGVSAATDVIETPAYFDDVILAYVIAHAYLKDSKVATSNYFFSVFNSMIEEYVAKILNRPIATK